jgi:hypothetical protein
VTAGPVIDDRDAPHVFRDAPGHLPDSAEARAALLALAADPRHCLGRDRYGTDWFARPTGDGGQLWAQVRAGRIHNGGLNRPPRDYFSVLTGLAREGKGDGTTDG